MSPTKPTRPPATASRPCPFCAHSTLRILPLRTRGSFAGPGSVYGYAIECEACGAHGPSGQDEAKALALWNARSDQLDLLGSARQ